LLLLLQPEKTKIKAITTIEKLFIILNRLVLQNLENSSVVKIFLVKTFANE
jgi:hypothetical protein